MMVATIALPLPMPAEPPQPAAPAQGAPVADLLALLTAALPAAAAAILPADVGESDTRSDTPANGDTPGDGEAPADMLMGLVELLAPLQPPAATPVPAPVTPPAPLPQLPVAAEAVDTAQITAAIATEAPAIDLPSTATDAPAPTPVAVTPQPAPEPAQVMAPRINLADPKWAAELARQIVAGSPDADQARFRLTPDHLGAVQVAVSHSAEGISMRFEVESDATRHILAASQDRLAAEFKALGLRVVETQVDLGSAGAQHRQSDAQQQQQHAQAATPIVRTIGAEPAPADTPDPEPAVSGRFA